MLCLEEDYKAKKVLVTGGLGFIGTNLVARLVSLGAEVAVFARVERARLEQWRKMTGLTVEIHSGDIRDENAVREAVRGQAIVFNLAGKSGSSASVRQPFLDLDVNCRGHLTLLEACREVNADVKVVFPGSRLQFGIPQYLPVDEKHPMEPLSPHGVHKLAVEKYHLLYFRLHKLKTTVLRISNPYGPGQLLPSPDYGIVNWFMTLAAQGKEILIYGDGSQTRDYLHVDDLVEVMLKAGLQDQANGEVFNVGGGEPIALRDMAEKVVRIFGSGSLRFVPWPADSEQVETGSYVTDITKAKRVLGWRPEVSFDEGIARSVQFYRNLN